MNIGVDIGGSHTGVGVVDPAGNIIEDRVFTYHNDFASIDTIFMGIKQFIDEKCKQYEIDSIGIGVPGVISGTKINYTCNLPLTGIDVRDYLHTSIPIYLSNDSNCAAIAEYEVVDKKFYSDYSLVTLGTGIGAGLIIDSKLYCGSSGGAGELGHMVIEKDGLKCNCGRRGCFEQYASVTALKRMTHLEKLKEIFYLAETNPSIQNVLEEYFDNLSEGLANFINIFDLEMIVIGGGISIYLEKYLPKLKTKILEKVCNKYTYELNIKVAELKNDAGIIGAALLHEYI